MPGQQWRWPCESGVPTKVIMSPSAGRRQTDHGTVVDAPQALSLVKEPQANVRRYDALRQVQEVRHAS